MISEPTEFYTESCDFCWFQHLILLFSQPPHNKITSHAIITYHIPSSTSFPIKVETLHYQIQFLVADLRMIQSVSNQSIILFGSLSTSTGGWKHSMDYFVLITVCINWWLEELSV